MLALRPTLAAPLLLGSVLACAAGPLRAQVTGAGPGGLNTTVNGVVGGSCTTGLCQVTGGTVGGSNLFHRFSSFDTRGAITGVQIHNLGLPNVVVGVTAPLGSFIDKPVSLSSPGNLFWLSPGGIAVSGSGGFINTNQLTLSTATNQLIGAGRFDVFGTTPQQAALLTGTPGTRARDLVLDPAVRAMAGMAPDPQIVLNGVQLTVDRSLLIDNPGGLVSVAGSTLSAASTTGTGGSITLTGPQVWVDGASSLLATGPSGGGLIQVGGSWQNSNPDVRQAITTWVGSGALLDASATVNGDGGEIVVWSDVLDPLSSTTARGLLKADAGPQGGDGGRIETSGHWLDLAGLRVSTLAPKGNTGVWLLDPSDITISSDPGDIPGNGSDPTVFRTSAATATVNVADLRAALDSSNVVITTESSEANSGNITLRDPLSVDSEHNLTLKADQNIYINANFTQIKSGSLELLAGQGFAVSGGVQGTGNLALNGGQLLIETDSSSPADYSGVISGSETRLVKRGLGVFSMTGANTYSGSTSVQEGNLRLGIGGSIADGSAMEIFPGATFTLAKSGEETLGSIAGSGSIILASSADRLRVGAADVSSSVNVYSGDISGMGSLVKVGAGQLNLSGANAYSGPTIVQQGILRAARTNSLGTGNVYVNAGGTVELAGGIVLDNNFQLDGIGAGSVGSLRNVSGSNTITGVVTLTESWNQGTGSRIASDSGTLVFQRQSAAQDSVQVSGISSGFDFVIGGAGNIRFGSSINLVDSSSQVTGGLVKEGSGTLTLSGTNNQIGAVRVNGGVLTVNAQPPASATCNGGTSNICPAPAPTPAETTAIELVQAPTLSVVPGFTVESTTTAPVTTNSSTTQISASTPTTYSDTSPPADGSTLIGSSSLSVVSTLDSSFTTLETSSASASQTAPATADSTNSSSATSDSGGTQAQETSATTTSGESASQQSQDASGNSSQEQSQVGESARGTANPAPTSTGVTAVSSEQAVAGVTQAEQSQSQALVNAVLPERIGSVVTAPTVTQMQTGLSNAAAFIRSGGGFGGGGGLGGGLGGGRGGAPNTGGGAGGARGVPAGAGGGGAETGGGLGPQSWLPRGLLIGGDSDQLMASVGTLIATSDVGRSAVLPPSFNRAAYNPAILHVRFTQERDKLSKPNSDAFLDITLIPRVGEPEGRRVELSRQAFAEDLRTLYRQLSRQESLRVNDPSSPSRRLYDLLFAAITPVLQQRGITTLMISADRGLQAVPFAALHNGEHYFGDRYAFSLTPSLALTNLGPPTPRGGRLLAAGASQFDGLAPLPLVPTELNTISSSAVKDTALNQQFTPSTLLQLAGDPRYSRVHVATHAEFLPGGPAKSKLYSGTVPIALSDFVKLRLARRDAPLDLISFSACRTALGDADSELGFAGLALQAGARSAVGTLWYVDDVATSAYFVQMYRYLDAGVPKAEALQLTRQAFSRGLVRLEGDQMVGPDGTVLFGGLNDAQQRRVADGLSNPYFWAGIELLGSPW